MVRESDLRRSRPVPLEDALPRHVTGKVVRVADLPPMIVGRIFERCEIWGPTPALIAPSKRTGVRWLLPTPDSFIVVSNFSRLPAGTVSFIDCAFVNCDLQEFRTIGTQEQIDLLRAEFTEP